MIGMDNERIKMSKLQTVYDKYNEAHKELIDMLFEHIDDFDWENLDVKVSRDEEDKDMLWIKISDYGDFVLYLQQGNIVLDWGEDKEYFDSAIGLFWGLGHLIRGAKLERELDLEEGLN